MSSWHLNCPFECLRTSYCFYIYIWIWWNLTQILITVIILQHLLEYSSMLRYWSRTLDIITSKFWWAGHVSSICFLTWVSIINMLFCFKFMYVIFWVVSIQSLQVDTAANVQPEKVDAIWNLRGILNTSWHKVQVRRASPGMNSNLWNKGGKKSTTSYFPPDWFHVNRNFLSCRFQTGTELVYFPRHLFVPVTVDLQFCSDQYIYSSRWLDPIFYLCVCHMSRR